MVFWPLHKKEGQTVRGLSLRVIPDDALVGYVERITLPTIACYNKDKCIEILMKDMTSGEAEEYFYYNVVGAYFGENTPCFLTIVTNDK